MSTYTPNLNLEKPGYNDAQEISTINANMDILDEAVGGNIQKSGGAMTGDLEFERITYKRFQLFDGDTLEYECVVKNDNAKHATYNTSMTEIGSYYLVDNISYTSVNFSESGSSVAWARVRMSDSITDIEPGEYTPTSASHGDTLESPKLVVSVFSIGTMLMFKTDGQMLVGNEQMYPTFIIGGWSNHSNQTTLPVTPCFVFNPANYSYYYCNGTYITRINPDEYMPISATMKTGSNLNNMAEGESWWGNNFTNAPTTDYYTVEMFSMVQVAYQYVNDTSSPRVYVRMCPNGVWQPWARLDNGDCLPVSGGAMTGDLEFEHEVSGMLLVQAYNGSTLLYEFVTPGGQGDSPLYDTSLNEIGTCHGMYNIGIGYSSLTISCVDHNENELCMIGTSGELMDAFFDAQEAEGTAYVDVGGTAYNDANVKLSYFNSTMETALEIKADGRILIKDEQAYPTFIRTGWSESSDESMLPSTPCFVLNPTNSAYYYCDGTTITRINPIIKLSDLKGVAGDFPEKQLPEYFITMDAFVDGGTLYWSSVSDVKTRLKYASSADTLEHRGTIPSTANLNDYRSFGIYQINSPAPNNCPATWSVLIVTGGTNVNQILIGQGNIRIRCLTGSPLNWTAWRVATMT